MLVSMEFQARRIQDSDQKWDEARPILRGMGILLLAVGAFFVVNGLYTGAQKYRRIDRWLPVNALVLDFKVLQEPCGHAGRADNCYRAYFTLQYAVQGRILISGTQSDHMGSYSSEVWDWIQYQRGSHQRIRYNPAQPEEVTVEDYNLRSFREPLKLGGWGTGLILIGLALTRSPRPMNYSRSRP
jgi:hypothetical protein